MIRFNNDYCETAHPTILKAIADSNGQQFPGYSADERSDHARELIRNYVGRNDCDVHFLVGGTITNMVFISHALRPFEAVIAANTGHINVHETGAIESCGHKVLAAPYTADGKLTPALVDALLQAHEGEHMVVPKMVYISQPTELGTLYTREEYLALSSYCKTHNLYFYWDGARLSSALTSEKNDLSLKEMAQHCDGFYLGGTKNGMLFGEALVINNEQLKDRFRFTIKHRGGLLAKGWLLGIQFETMLETGLFEELGAHANLMAKKLRQGIAALGYTFEVDSYTNQIFPIFPNHVLRELTKSYDVLVWSQVDTEHTAVRMVTSWATKPEHVDAFLKDLQKLHK